jgi:hypothetical protein
MQMLTADRKTIDFYKKNGFERAGKKNRCGFTKETNIKKSRQFSVFSWQ